MKYDLTNSDQVIRIRDRVEWLIKNKKFAEVKDIKPIRSDQQNKYLHLILNFFAIEFGYTLQYVKQKIFKEIVNRDLFRIELSNKEGEVYEDWRSSANLDSKEMAKAIDRFREYSDFNGLHLPDSDESEFLKFAEIEIEKHEKYL